jgi:hypothetical protein
MQIYDKITLQIEIKSQVKLNKSVLQTFNLDTYTT